MILWFIRAVFFLLIVSLLLLGFTEGGPFNFENTLDYSIQNSQLVAIIGCLAVMIIGLSLDLFLPRKQVVSLAGLFFGVLVGLLIGMAFNYILDLIYEAYTIPPSHPLFVAKNGIKSIITVLCCYLTVAFILQTKDDFRFIIPYVEFSKQTKGNQPLLLDTSVIIDGRISDIAETKFLSASMIVPRFVLDELQLVADSSDRLRRNRGRRGLDILKKMQTNKDIDIQITDVGLGSFLDSEPVDLRLVSAAKKIQGKIITNDYNLNKVANLRGVEVLNVNDLANALKVVVLPGEGLDVYLVKPGDQPGQGVGYLDDGTMVVVEQGKNLMGQKVRVVVTSVLQTSAGRMIFSKAGQ